MATRNQPQLTELAMLAECTGKAGASLLADVLDRINRWQSGNGSHERTDLIVGLSAPTMPPSTGSATK